MSDLNRPHENRLKGKFKGLLHRLMGANRPRDERAGGSRLAFMTPIPTDSILTRYRSTFTRAPQVTGEGTSLVCLQCANNSSAHIPCLRESQNVMQGAHNIIMRDSTFYVAKNVCPETTALMV
jgi:hypothetical protein